MKIPTVIHYVAERTSQFLSNTYCLIYTKLKSRRKPILYSMALSLLLIITGYFINNSSLFTGEAASKMHIFEKISKYLNSDNQDSIPSDIAYFNIDYHKSLTPVYVNGRSVGQTPITDRRIINSFLKLLKDSTNYKFVVLDVFLNKADNATFPQDSLYNTLASFDNRILMVDRDNAEFAFPQLSHFTALAKYNTSKISKAFSRYKYMYGDDATIPLQLYQKLNPDASFKRIGLLDWLNISPYIKDIFSLYFLNNKLVQNSLFLQFDEYTITKPHKYKTEGGIRDLFDYENVGKYIDNDNIVNRGNLLSDIVNNKIVIIGNISGKEDSHGTYMDKKCGPEILTKAYTSLNQGLTIVTLPYILFWFIIFSIVCFLIINDKPLIRKPTNIGFITNKTMCFLLSLLSYSTILFGAMMCDYFIFHRSYSLVIPILVFTFLKLYIQYKKL